jgi:putative ABC transport system permease protein
MATSNPDPIMTIIDDAKRAMRTLIRRPAYAVTTVVLLILGTTAAAAVFAVVNASILQPLPFDDPDRIHVIQNRRLSDGENGDELPLSAAQLLRMQSIPSSFERIESFEPRRFVLSKDDLPRAVTGGAVGVGLFSLLGVDPVRGRLFAPDEGRPGNAVVIVSEGLWSSEFGRAGDIVGRRIVVDGAARAIIGVMPRGFRPLMQPGDMWVPTEFVGGELATAATRNLLVAGRLESNALPDHARTEVDRANQQLAQELPALYRDSRATLQPLAEFLYGSRTSDLFFIASGVGLLLVLLWANLANLALARSVAATAESGLRLALGASTGALARARLAEAIVVALAGTAIGVVLGKYAVLWVTVIDPQFFSLLSIDYFGGATLGFAVFLLLAAVAAIGGPAIIWERNTGFAAIRTARIIGDRAGSLWREGLVAAQVALTVLLLFGAGLLTKQYQRLASAGLGFRPDSVLAAQLLPSAARYATAQERAEYLNRVADELRAIPGVLGVSSTQATFGLGNMLTVVEIEGAEVSSETHQVNIRHVLPGFFDVMNVPVEEGRSIDATDRIGTTPVAVVSRAFAKRFWPDRSAVGRRLRRPGANPVWVTVVGVAGDIRDNGLAEETGPTLYMPYNQRNSPITIATLLIKSRGNAALEHQVRSAIARVDPLQLVDRVMPVSEAVAASVAAERLHSLSMATFGASALLVAVAGLFALATFTLHQRRREVAIRMAIGASRTRALITMGRWTLRPALLGATAGIALTLASTGLVEAIAGDIGARDPVLLAAVAGLLLIVSLAVIALPAGRTMRTPLTLIVRD